MSALAEAGWVAHVDDTFAGNIGNLWERQHNALKEIALQTDPRHKNLSGIVHGGVLMTLVDRAIGINCQATAPSERMATASLTVNFLRQVRIGDVLQVSCRLRKEGRKAIFADADVRVDDRLVATATGVWMKVA